MQYYVYMITNWNNKVLYTGVTNNLDRRINEHKLKILQGFTNKYKVNKLVYYEITTDINSAILREKQIKGYKRSKKDKLINSMNPGWIDLSNDFACL